MVRNIAKPLGAIKAAKQSAMEAALVEVDFPVCVTYAKRNGEVSTSTGVPRFFNGSEGMDTRSVTLETPDKGFRTINLHRIINLSRASD